MSNVDFAVLCEQAKAYAGFEPEDELVLVQEAPSWSRILLPSPNPSIPSCKPFLKRCRFWRVALMH